VFGAEAKPDQAGRESAQERQRPEKPQSQRRRQLSASFQNASNDAVLQNYLQPLRRPGRKIPMPLHRIEVLFGHRALEKARRQDIGGGNSVLHGEIDSNAAYRGHGMGGVVDT
jgi:hypothetical protein